MENSEFTVYTLPDYLKLDSNSELQVFDYVAADESTKNMVNLTMNTCSFLLEGIKEVVTGEKTVGIENQEFLVMKAGHCLMTERFSSPAKYRSLLLFFSNDAILSFCRKHQITLQKSNGNQSVMAFRKDPFLNSFIQGLLEVSRMPQGVRESLLTVKFEELMLYMIAKNGTGFIHTLIHQADDQSRKFTEVVENNKLNKLSLKELAFLSNMSLSTFKREFEKQYGESPSRWFQEQRLEYSAFLLKNKAKRPSDIFDEVGYENLSNFIHAFKLKFGTTPKQYQQE